MDREERTLRVYSVDGLCNRLLVLLSGRAIAEASGRRFAMEWVPTKSCTCPFDQLFENDWGVESIEHPSPGTWLDIRMRAPGKFPNLLDATDKDLRILHYDWMFDTRLYPAHKSLQARAEHLFTELKPIPSILEKIGTLRADNFRPTMIGVHLRRGDFITGRPELVGNLKQSLRAVDKCLEKTPEAGILLCTDDGAPLPHSPGNRPKEGVREMFRARYGERVVSPTPQSLDRASPIAIQDALAELWLLRETQSLVGTAESTFSYLAGLGRDIPIFMTGGMTLEYARRLKLRKLTGLYYLLVALGRIEFGANTPYRYSARIYKRRIARLRDLIRV
jgi:hypothetical protein